MPAALTTWAIGATANKALRARKLVATNKYGQLPSNIIRPRWRELKGVPAGLKDGVDDVGPAYENRVVYDSAAGDGRLPAGEQRRVDVRGIDRGAGILFSVVPMQTNHNMRIDDVLVWFDNDGSQGHSVYVSNTSPWPCAFKLRATIFA